MDNLLHQGWYALQIVWSGARSELGGSLIFLALTAAILILIWFFWTPEVKRKGG